MRALNQWARWVPALAGVALVFWVGAASYTVPVGSGSSASQSPWATDINGAGFNLTNVGTITFPTTSRGALQLNGTNGTPVVLTAASSNSVPVTNVVGLIHKASAAVIVVDCNNANKFQITNQLGQATSIIVTNLAQGQEISISGSASGADRAVTVIPQLGFLVRDFDTFGVAAAASKAFTATNGNTFEVNIAAKWGFGTNFADVVTRQAKY